MGVVYRATQLSLQRTVAIKFLRPAREPSRGDPTGALAETKTVWLTPLPAPASPGVPRESRLMASLNHPHVVDVYDSGEVEGWSYLILEYVEGPNLRSLMRPGQPWPAARALPVLLAVADALAHVHGRGLLHLDLKPENVLLGEGGQVKVTDFGLALSQGDAGTRSEGGVARGTLDYCAPEQRFSRPTTVRSDLFALATLAYELLTGRLPGRAYVPCSQYNPGLNPAIDDALCRALASEPDERQETVQEFRRQLAAALGRPRRRYATWAGLALLPLALGLVAWLASGIGRRRADDRSTVPDPAPPARQENAPEPSAPVALTAHAWAVHDRPETLAWLDWPGLKDLRTGSGGAVQALRVSGDQPAAPGPPLPFWPSPRPVLVLTAPETVGFFHPLEQAALPARLVRAWPRWGPAAPRDNRVRAGDFEGDCLGKNGPWLWEQAKHDNWKRGDAVRVAPPPDRPGNNALQLVKKDPKHPTREVGCWQSVRMSGVPAGTLMLLRYRARAAEVGSRLVILVRHRLTVPVADRGPVAQRLRALCTEKGASAAVPGEALRYRLADWVKPTAEWQTYQVVWEWPPYASSKCELEISARGLGQLWVDDVELFRTDGIGRP
jgi:hypothetical protein